MSNLFKSLGLVGALSLSSALLTSPSHAAFVICSPTNATALWNSLATGDTCTVGDKKLTILQNTMDNPNGVLTFSSPTGMPEVHTLTATGGSFDTSGVFKYSLEVVGSPELIKSLSYTNGTSLTSPAAPNYTWGIDILGTTSTPNFTYSDTKGPNPPLVLTPITPNQGIIEVTHNYSLGSGAPMQQFTDSVMQTPGPLPILGAGAAFGFSRTMRRRIKASA
jgi:hypothetical protein